jgi:hypothetical protein
VNGEEAGIVSDLSTLRQASAQHVYQAMQRTKMPVSASAVHAPDRVTKVFPDLPRGCVEVLHPIVLGDENLSAARVTFNKRIHVRKIRSPVAVNNCRYAYDGVPGRGTLCSHRVKVRPCAFARVGR